MISTLNLLVIEDSEADFLLVERTLNKHGLVAELHRVDTYSALTTALEAGGWDAILSDYHLPGMDFRHTLHLIKSKLPDLPVILVSGSIGEEEAMDLLHSGLSDFVLKDRPARLAGALRHNLETAKLVKAQRESEAALIESEARFSTMFRSSPIGIGVSRMSNGALVEVNEALLEIFMAQREDLIGLTTVQAGFFLHAEDRERMLRTIQGEGRVRNFQFQFQRKDGELRDLLMSGERIQLGGEDYLLGMVSDITPLMAAERSLQTSEGRYRTLFENMVQGFAHNRLIFEDGVPVDWEYLEVNPAFHQVTGLKDLVGRRVSQVLPTLRADNPDLFKMLEGVVRTGVPAKFEAFVPSLNKWVSNSAYRPAPGEFVAMLEDITSRKWAEQALRISEMRFQSVFRASPVGIVLSQLDTGKVLDANETFLKGFGFTLDEVLGRSTVDLGIWLNPRDRENAMQVLRETGRLHAMDAELRTAAGEQIYVTWSTEVVELEHEKVMVNIVQDMTGRKRADQERERLQAEVAHAQKLESLGALAGGVSHDMNNVLAAIMALASTLKETHGGEPDVSKAMDTLLHAAGRGRDLVKGLTDFARKDIPEPKRMDLNEVVRTEANLLSRTTLQKVAVEMNLAENLPEVTGDASSISNALMNLCVNALDAMPSGGRIRLSTRVGLDDQVELSVKDSGQGMTPEVVRRAMEPFFTTKPAGKGTGLGLALVYGVMKAHGGHVDILSRVNEGTEIVLSLPRHSPGSLAAAESAPLAAKASQSLEILLVDDDDLIRMTVPLMLETLGHRVVPLAGGLEALRRLQSGLDPDLVILDLSMPGMDGEEALSRIRLLRPDVSVLLSTGFQDERLERILERFPGVGVIGKPFTLNDLKARLAQMK